jgi:hypothetical protein
MASPPAGQPTFQVSERQMIALSIRSTVVSRRGSPADDRLDGRVAQAGFLHGCAQQYAVVGRRVYLNDDPMRRPVKVVFAGPNDRHGAPRRYGHRRSGGTHPTRSKVA